MPNGETFTRCSFKSPEEKREAIREFVRKYGDGIPEDALNEAVSPKNLDKWFLRCNEMNELVSSARYDDNTDWYACTIKNLATRPDYRKKGLGSEVANEAINKAKDIDKCKVLLADITFDNVPSKRIIEHEGFKQVDRFCWKKGEKPSDIMHYILVAPDNANMC